MILKYALFRHVPDDKLAIKVAGITSSRVVKLSPSAFNGAMSWFAHLEKLSLNFVKFFVCNLC